MRDALHVGGHALKPPVWILGPDVIESERFTLELAVQLRALAEERGLSLVFKASYEKANRTSARSYRGPGAREGLRTLARVKQETGLPVLSDIHDLQQVGPAAEVLDVIQIPAFLCRQNELLEAVARTGRTVNLKKGQFLAPWDVAPRVRVLEDAGAREIWVTERGVSFGYRRLVNDFRAVPEIQATGAACIFDATHSVQTPAGAGDRSGGERRYIPVLARAAAAAGVDGFFLEVHPRPAEALCDGPNSMPLERLPALLDQLVPIAHLVRSLAPVVLDEEGTSEGATLS